MCTIIYTHALPKKRAEIKKLTLLCCVMLSCV